jgi:hypothetical protein
VSVPLFTKGPWNVQRDGQIWCDDHPIVEKLCSGPWGDVGVDFLTGEESLVHWWGTVATDEAKANANLIASAPELYAELDCREGDLVMLRRAIEEGDPKRELLFRIDDMLRETRKALSKIRGEANSVQDNHVGGGR